MGPVYTLLPNLDVVLLMDGGLQFGGPSKKGLLTCTWPRRNELGEVCSAGMLPAYLASEDDGHIVVGPGQQGKAWPDALMSNMSLVGRSGSLAGFFRSSRSPHFSM